MKLIISLLVLCNLKVVAQQNAKPGSVAANAKTIAAENLFPFLHGVAVTKKGNSCALIDANGNVLVPYGKYSNLIGPYYGGLIMAYDNSQKWGTLLNCRGQVVKNLTAKDSYYAINTEDVNPSIPFAIASHYSNATEPGKTSHILKGYVAIDSSGFEIQLGGIYNPSYGEGLISYSTGIGIGSNPKIGFKNRKDQVVIPAQFDDVSGFSEGLAAVAKRDASGTLQWGFIDKSGKQKIPYQYANQPGDFGNDVAAVYPKTSTDFSMALINHSGTIELKVPKDMTGSGRTKSTKFEYGLFPLFDRTYIAIDSTGSLSETESFLAVWDVEDAKNYKVFFDYSSDYLAKVKGQPTPLSTGQYIYGTRSLKDRRLWQFGIVDLTKKLMYPNIFSAVSPFDRTSKLAWAKLFLNLDPQTNAPRFREGYVNEKLQFILVKEEPSVF